MYLKLIVVDACSILFAKHIVTYTTYKTGYYQCLTTVPLHSVIFKFTISLSLRRAHLLRK